MRMLALLACLATGVLIAPADSRAGPPIWMLARSLRPASFHLAPSAPASALSFAPSSASSPGEQCRAAIAAAEQANGIPPHLLGAIGHVESGRREPSGEVNPWPWSINVEGVDHVYDSEAEAIAGVRGFQAKGARSIDVGCLQVNLMYHPDAFATLEDAFDPVRNAQYAARFLVQLHQQSGSWTTATAWYHSATPELGSDYARKVMAALPQEQAGQLASTGMLPPAAAGSQTQTGGPGPYMLSSTVGAARLIAAGSGTVGRTLAAYRAVPIRIAGHIALP